MRLKLMQNRKQSVYWSNRTIAPGMDVWRLPEPEAVKPNAFACPKSASLAVRPSYRTFLEDKSR